MKAVTESAELAKRFLRVGAHRIAHFDEGEGPPILFVHGVPTSCYLWRKVILGLRDRFRCIAPDLFGLGDTEGPTDADFSMPAQAEMLRAFLEAKGLSRVHLVCHDQGGAAAQILVARYPEMVDRWVVTNSVAYDNWPVPVIRLLRAVAARPWLYWGLSVSGVGSAIARSRIGFPRGVAESHTLDDAAIDEYLRPTHSEARAPADLDQARERLRRFALAGDCRHTLEVVPKLRSFTRPTLVLWGEDDRFIPVRWGRRLADDVPGAIGLETIPSCGHFVPEERPELLAERIASFFAADERQAPASGGGGADGERGSGSRALLAGSAG